MSMSTSDMTRIKRLETVVPTRSPTFNYLTPVYGGTPSSNGEAKSFVLACIDPRFTAALESYLLRNLGTNSYDLFILAGASMGGNLTSNGTFPATIPACNIVSAGNNWQETLFDHIQVAISLHNVTQVIIIDHLGCGAYGQCVRNDSTVSHETQYDDLVAAIKAASFYANGTLSPTAKQTGSTIFGTNFFGYIFNTPVGSSTTLIDYTLVEQSVEFFPPTTMAKVLVLGCIDPRYSALLSSFLTTFKDVQYDFDLFILAGSSLGVNQSYNLDGTQRTQGEPGTAYTQNVLADSAVLGPLGHKWGPTFFDHLSIARALHGITEVWAFDHLDCGAYKNIKLASGGVAATTDLNINQHTPELEKLRLSIENYTSKPDPLGLNDRYSLGFKGFVMDTSGQITKVIDDLRGLNIDPQLSTFGSSRVRSPASDIIDLRAKASADYVLKVETRDTNPGIGFSNQLQLLKLTPTPSQKTILNPKVILRY